MYNKIIKEQLPALTDSAEKSLMTGDVKKDYFQLLHMIADLIKTVYSDGTTRLDEEVKNLIMCSMFSYIKEFAETNEIDQELAQGMVFGIMKEVGGHNRAQEQEEPETTTDEHEEPDEDFPDESLPPNIIKTLADTRGLEEATRIIRSSELVLHIEDILEATIPNNKQEELLIGMNLSIIKQLQLGGPPNAPRKQIPDKRE